MRPLRRSRDPVVGRLPSTAMRVVAAKGCIPKNQEDVEHCSQVMPAESIYVAELMLPFQAVGIGEAHDNSRGRQKILEWIKKDWVADLVVELPSFASATDIAAIDVKWSNQIPLAQLIQNAVANNVTVHQWDDWFKYGIEPGSPKGMKNRNRRVAASFRQHFGQQATDAHHCVVLFGARHFDGPAGFEMLLPGLKWADLGG